MITRSFDNIKFLDNNVLVGIQNEDGEYLYVPKYILDMYVNTSPRLLDKLAENIDQGRELKIGAIVDGEMEEVTVSTEDKGIFYEDESEVEENVLFPELVHGDDVVLEGEVTRENKTSNSMGFKYEDHILTAYPESGSIVPYKPLLFLKCRLYGTVNRLDEKGRIAARRPKLYFDRLEPLESDENDDLFI